MKKPVIIIVGAARSGTNMLRDILCFFNGVETWPCDEINYIWRYGNASFPTDGFSRDMATKKVVIDKNYVFEKLRDILEDENLSRYIL